MYKVIVERPRNYKGGWRRAARLRDDFDGPAALGMRAGYGSRVLNENLSPLRRFLRAQVGRPWTKVFSEICAGLDRRNTVQQHIHQHIDDFIARTVAVREGKLIALASEPLGRNNDEVWQELYVDPRTGLIRLNRNFRSWRVKERQQAATKAAAVRARRRDVAARMQLHLLGGVWFEVTLAELPPVRRVTRVVAGEKREHSVYEPHFDAVLKRPVRPIYDYLTLQAQYGDGNVYAVAKRQLAKKELKRANLNTR